MSFIEDEKKNMQLFLRLQLIFSLIFDKCY